MKFLQVTSTSVVVIWRQPYSRRKLRKLQHIAKTSSGDWRYVDTGHLVEDEDFGAGWDLLYQPECTTGANYFIQATNSGPLMEAECRRTIAALRREAADLGHCREFRDQCTKMADQLESGDCDI